MSTHTLTTMFVIRAPGVVLMDMGDIILARSASSGKTLVLNRTAGLVLTAAETAHTVDDLTSIVADKYKVAAPDITNDTMNVVTEFLAHGLLIPTS